MNGSGNQQAYVSVARTGQDQGGNYTQFLGGVRYYGNGWGTYSGSTWYWSSNFGGHAPSGGFNVPYAERNNTFKDLYWGYFNKGHDAGGYLGAFGCASWIDTDHGSTGDGGASTTEEAAPRIPKRPSTPGAPSFTEVTPTSVRVSWGGSADNGGSNIDAYLLRWRNASPFNGSGYSETFQGNTSRVVSGLTPGVRYYWGVYAHNGSADNGGYSNPSPESSLLQPSGVYVSDGSKWVATQSNISDGAAWDSIQPTISDGDSWEAPLNV
jgi:hypothetical protein